MDYFNELIEKISEEEIYFFELLRYNFPAKIVCHGPFDDYKSISEYRKTDLVQRESFYVSTATTSVKKYYPGPLKLHILSKSFNPKTTGTIIHDIKNFKK